MSRRDLLALAKSTRQGSAKGAGTVELPEVKGASRVSYNQELETRLKKLQDLNKSDKEAIEVLREKLYRQKNKYES